MFDTVWEATFVPSVSDKLNAAVFDSLEEWVREDSGPENERVAECSRDLEKDTLNKPSVADREDETVDSLLLDELQEGCWVGERTAARFSEALIDIDNEGLRFVADAETSSRLDESDSEVVAL